MKELLDLCLRWTHLIAGIMWLGNSMLFNWLDRNLVQKPEAGPLFQGEIWMVHSGGFYQVEKKLLPPGALPTPLHWFKWQSYITWLSGFSLLLLVYYAQEGLLVDPEVRKLGHAEGVGIGIAALAGGFFAYDALWRSPLGTKAPRVAVALSFALLAGVVFGLTHTLSGRAAYLHVGALLGTVMSGNVFFHIIPSQRELVRATAEGRPQDPRLGAHAKQRSIHNNYATFPVLFIMLSTHFPSTYGSTLNWLVLGVVVVTGALVRHFMNIRFWFRRWLVGFVVTAGAGLALVAFLTTRPAPAAPIAAAPGGKVPFATVRLVLAERCAPCHSAHPTDDVWKIAPNGVTFDTPDQVRAHAERIKARAVVGKTMPLGNKTHMTDEERDLLARWLYGGAPLD